MTVFLSPLDERLKRVLQLVVEDVIQTGEPVGSQRFVEMYDMRVSPATIRNWFVELEENGFLAQPHTSAGRLPTEQGYRLYLEELMDEMTLRQRDVAALERLMDQTEDDQLLKELAKMTSELTGDVAIVSQDDREIFTTGVSRLSEQPEFYERDQIQELFQALDRVHDVMSRMRKQTFDEPKVFIGRECPFGDSYASVFMNLDDGRMLSVLGPMRMDYRRAMALLRAARDLMHDES